MQIEETSPTYGMTFIRHNNYFDKDINKEFLSQKEYRTGWRYIKAQILKGAPTTEQIDAPRNKKYSFSLVNINIDTCVTNNISPAELSAGWRNVKILMANPYTIKYGFLTDADILNGWEQRKCGNTWTSMAGRVLEKEREFEKKLEELAKAKIEKSKIVEKTV